MAAALETHPSDQPSPGAPGRGHRVRAVDFSRPTKFSSEHQRRITRGLETFCQTAAARLSAELRTAVEIEVVSSDQLTWSKAQSEIPSNSLAATLETQPADTRMLLLVQLPLVLTAVECLLGGSPAAALQERRMSEIDWSLSGRLVTGLVQQLSLVWQDLAGLELTATDLELASDAVQIAGVSEPTFIVLMQARIGGQVAMLSLLVPWRAIDPVSERLAGHDSADAADNRDAADALQAALAHVPVTLRAEVGAREMAVEEVLSLGPGSVVALGGPADDGVSLFVETRQLARAQPGRSGARRAVRIEPGAAPRGQRVPHAAADGVDRNPADLHGALRDTRLRVWAELGRTSMALARALELPPGALVELDHRADSPVELFVNGLRFARGHLVVTDEGEWAIRLLDA